MKMISDAYFSNRIELRYKGKKIQRALSKISSFTSLIFALGLAVLISIIGISLGSARDAAAQEVLSLTVQVATSSDDAEESSSGSVDLTSSDLELVLESSIQTVGMRFTNVSVPQGSTIAKAYIQFQADETNSEPTTLSIQGQAAINAPAFTSTNGNISNRARTAATVSWNPEPWSVRGEAGPNQQTPDITPVIQEIVSQSSWSDGNSLVIIITGSGKRVAESYNGDQAGAPLLHLEYYNEPPANQAPTVNAGQDQVIIFPNQATLNGTVTDDGLPNPPGSFTTSWSQVNGPGTVSFTDASAINTSASFPTDGVYVLQLTANDSELSTSDEITITVYQEGTNLAPTVNAGPDQTITLPNALPLSGTVTDDGLPNPPGSVTTSWSKVSGPGTVNLTNSSAINTTASFSTAGVYTLRLTADDSELSASDEVEITVNPPGPITFEVRVAASSDDAEEGSSGSVGLTSSDLELVLESSLQTVGMRFNNVTVPQGSTITNAFIQFQADETNSEPTMLSIQGQLDNNASTFTSTNGDISNRTRTTAEVSWNPEPWTVRGEAGPNQQTPDITPVIQEIVNQPGWSDGNSLVIITTGSGKRVAESYDGVPSGAPLLHVEYYTEPPANQAPTVNAGPDQTITLPNTLPLSGTVTDDGLPNPPGSVTTSWSKVSGPGTVNLTNSSAINTTASFSTAGVYTLRLTADDSELSTSDEIVITVNPPGPITFETRVAASSDDAEESSSGSVGLTSSDLELVLESSLQTVGMRFNIVTVPQGSTIAKAYIQFQADETNSETTTLSLQGQLDNSALTFASITGNISNRARTGATVSWNPEPWTTSGEAGPNQQTPDITPVIQEIVNQPGWSDGNSLVIIITGAGKRVAESFNGVPSGAPLLHLEYFILPPTNQAPTVNAGQDQVIILPNNAILDGSVADDGLPNPPGSVTTSWSQVSGPGSVIFADSSSVDTTASFSTDGDYILRLTADDGELSFYDEVTITVNPEDSNQAPTVNAGQDQTITLSNGVILDGTVDDDGLPNPPGSLTITWSIVDGPGTVTFADSDAVDTNASFSTVGVYVLRLTANDGQLTAYDDVTITVLPVVTIQVPQDQLTIQEGINAAQDGNLVLVSPGTYNETLTISGKTITLASLFHTTHDTSYIDQTIIDGSGGTPITVAGIVGSETKIIGFTIRNGTDGISADAMLHILNNRFTGNGDAIDYEGGGGICRNNVFENNSDDAVDLDGSTEAIIENNIIRNNGDDGIEIRLHGYSGPTLNIIIRNNIISGNDEDGIQLIDYSDVSDRFFLIERNLIEANALVGLGLMDNGDTTEDFRAASIPERIHLFNNTFIGNDYGLTGGDNLIALNNLFVNSASIGVKGLDGTSIAAYNLFWNNGIDNQGSNIDTDTTLFVDPQLDADHYLQLGSPAIDTGTTFFEWQSETVLDMPSTAYYGLAPDIGLYESNFNQPPIVDAGADQTTMMPNSVALSGIVTDDGLPDPPGVLDTTWSKISGPGAVTYTDASMVDTTASFSTNGVYVLRLTADDGELTVSDEVTITVSFRFVSWGDTKSSLNDLAALSNQAVILAPALTIYAGDLESDGFTLSGMNAWKEAMNGFTDNGMFYKTFPVRGNHDENDTPGWQSYYDMGLTAQSLGATNYTALNEDLTYSFDYGNAHFIGVDVLGNAPNLTSEQVSWIDNDLSAAEARGLTHAFVYFHGPIYCVDGHCSCTTRTCPLDPIVVDLISVFNQHPIVSATFHGHEHTYAHVHLDDTRIPEITQPFEQFITGAAGAGPSACIPGRTDYCMPSLGFVTVDVLGNSFSVDFYELGTASPVKSMTFTKSGNQSPSVDAGFDQSVTLPDNASLDGTVSDDGLPAPPNLTITWSVANGPGTVTFADANAVDTTASFSFNGVYVLRLTANDGELTASDELTITVNPQPPTNQPPSVNAGSDQTITLPSFASLDGTVSDDGLPTPPNLSTLWSVVSGPGTVTFGDPNAVDTTTSFSTDGIHVLRLTANDGELSNFADVTITVNPQPPVNQPPSVNAGSDQTITLPSDASLDGTVSDDGLPAPPNLTTTWTIVSGPGTVTFTNANAVDTTASFSTDGLYVLRLTANDGELSSFDEATTTVNPQPPANQPPSVSAGPDQTITLTSDASLDGTVSDDGLPFPPGSLTTTWSMVSGPGTVTFADASAVDTTANFSTDGVYVLRLTADDGLLTTSDEITITVNSSTPITLDIRVAASSDDAEEKLSSGRVGLTSSDLELVLESEIQTVGMRFNGATIPQGATITRAYIQFKVDETNSDTTVLTIEGQADANPLTFVTTNYNISSRYRTEAKVPWSPEPWTTRGEAGPAQQTPEIVSIIQELVNQAGWLDGNSMVFIITGSGKRVAESYNGDQAGAPLLHVEYTTGPPNLPPEANNDTAETPEEQFVTIDVATNDSDPDGALNLASTNITCATCYGPAHGILNNNGDGTFEYTPDPEYNGADSFVYEICDTNGACDTAMVNITITPVVDPPVANDDSDSTQDNTPVTIDVAANDTDPDGDLDPTTANITCSTCIGPTNGGLVNNGDGTFVYTPNQDYNGPDSFVYKICDVGGLCDTATVYITVTMQNDPPTANNDNANTPEETLVTIDVAANDNDPDGNLDPSSTNTTCATCYEPTHGNLNNNGDGSFAYTPTLDYNGADSFVYEICDTLNACDTAMANITIIPVADPPFANDDTANTPENTPVTIDVAANDTDPDGDLDPMTANITCSTCFGPTNGSLVNNGDGTFEYSPNVGFSGPDSFVYEICDVGGLCDTATVNITVNPSAPITFEARVAASSDDAEESSSGSVGLTSSDLELVQESSIQTVGMRFNGVTIPQGANISSAYIQFKVDETKNSDPTTLFISGEKVSNASTFINSANNITNRTPTDASVEWSPIQWTTVGQAGPDQQTPNITSVIQEIVDQPGWMEGNSLVILITGSGKRVAESYNGDQAGAPLLHVEFFIGTPSDPPVAVDDLYETDEDNPLNISKPGVLENDSDPENDSLTALPSTQASNGFASLNSDGSLSYTPEPNFSGTDTFTYVANDGYSNSNVATVTITVNAVNDLPDAVNDTPQVIQNSLGTIAVLDNDDFGGDGPSTGSITILTSPNNGSASVNENSTPTDPTDDTVDYTPKANYIGPDSFTYEICDSNSDCDSATVDITVTSAVPVTLDIRVAASSDDAEESSSGSVGLTSSDLELVLESSIQTVGMRFNNIAIPQGAAITNAYLQFQADETNSEPTTLSIQGQLINNPPTFSSTSGNISNRTRTSAAVSWNPDPWTVRGEAGPNQQTPDIAPIIQEIVDQSSWTGGNSLVIIITGTGKRVAESYNGDQAGAPLLHVEYYAIPMTDLGSGLEFTTISGTYVTFGDPAKLDLTTFTIETWFKRTGTGTTSTTGSGGIPYAIPLVTHGAPQAEGSNVDANWVLVIDDAADVIAADFEDMAAGTNHPVYGVTPITNDIWHHAAATWDGNAWRLYLDGKLETTLAVSALPRSDTTQHAALGTMLTTGEIPTPNGYFQGVIDEARVWNRALTQTEILTNINQEITSGTGLVARWGLNEGMGTMVVDSITPAANGTIAGSNYAWVPGAPFDLDLDPGTPTLVAPADGATGVSTSATLTVNVDDARDSDLTVSFYGLIKNGAPGADFTLIAIPDPQYYASTYPSIYNAQMDWVVAEKLSRNIKYVMSLGDNVNTNTSTTEWNNAVTAWDILTAGSVPYGLVLGNHDGAPSDTANFNAYFGTRVSTQPTYAGRYGTSDYDNTYATFSASGMDFIVLFIEYDSAMTSTTHPVLVWANSVLQANPTRRAIVVTHNLLSGNNFTNQGSAIYNALKENPNLFLMLGGHIWTTGQRTDVYNGHTVYSLRSDYQELDSRQSGYLRAMRFSPTDGQIHVSTYSPTQEIYLTDTANQFDLAYAMDGVADFSLIDSTTVPSGSDASVTWSGLTGDTDYEWYAVADNGGAAAVSSTWSFTTTTGAQSNSEGNVVSLQIEASDEDLDTLTYTASGLPEGLSIDSATGLISGTINYLAANNSPYSVTVTADDGSDLTSEIFAWSVVQAASGLCGYDASLVGCWPMEEGSGTTLIDATSFGNDGNITGVPTWVTGYRGQALNLSGTGQYAIVVDDNSLDISNAITLAAWIRSGKTGTQNIIKKTLGTTTANGYEISLSSSGKVFVRLNGNAAYRIDSTTSYPIN